MVTGYSVVSESDLAVFTTRMNDALAKGWQPYEGLQVSTALVGGVSAPLYSQALVKISDPVPAEEEFLVK